MRELKPPIFFLDIYIVMAIYNRGRKFNVPGGRAKPRFIRPKRTIVKKAVRTAMNKRFEKRVENIIDKQAEVKQKTYVLTKSAVPGGAYWQYIRGGGLESGTVTDNGFVVPNILNSLIIAPGTGSSDRIGLSVNVKELRLKGMIHAMPYSIGGGGLPGNTNLSPFEVVMVVYKNKNDVTGSATKLKLDEETNSAIAINSDAYNDMYPWNRADYTIKKVLRMRFKGPPVAVEEPASSGNYPVFANPIYGDASNKLCHRFNISVPIKKELTWNSPWANAANKLPQNEWLSVGFYLVNLDGTTPPNTQARATIYLNATLRYTDA